MNLPDVNEMYPQVEGKVYGECTYCGTEMFIGEHIVKFEGFPYCDRICMATELLRSGEARRVVAGQ